MKAFVCIVLALMGIASRCHAGILSGGAADYGNDVDTVKIHHHVESAPVVHHETVKTIKVIHQEAPPVHVKTLKVIKLGSTIEHGAASHSYAHGDYGHGAPAVKVIHVNEPNHGHAPLQTIKVIHKEVAPSHAHQSVGAVKVIHLTDNGYNGASYGHGANAVHEVKTIKVIKKTAAAHDFHGYPQVKIVKVINEQEAHAHHHHHDHDVQTVKIIHADDDYHHEHHHHHHEEHHSSHQVPVTKVIKVINDAGASSGWQ